MREACAREKDQKKAALWQGHGTGSSMEGNARRPSGATVPGRLVRERPIVRQRHNRLLNLLIGHWSDCLCSSTRGITSSFGDRRRSYLRKSKRAQPCLPFCQPCCSFFTNHHRISFQPFSLGLLFCQKASNFFNLIAHEIAYDFWGKSSYQKGRARAIGSIKTMVFAWPLPSLLNLGEDLIAPASRPFQKHHWRPSKLIEGVVDFPLKPD